MAQIAIEEQGRKILKEAIQKAILNAFKDIEFIFYPNVASRETIITIRRKDNVKDNG